jgi:hypothetical protein
LHTYVASICPNASCVFQTYVASLILMLHMFHTYIASVLSGCCVCVCNGFQMFSRVCASASLYTSFKCFIYMLQVLHLDVSKVDRVLHIGCVCEVGGAPWASARNAGTTGDVRAARALTGGTKWRRRLYCNCRRPSERWGVSSPINLFGARVFL